MIFFNGKKYSPMQTSLYPTNYLEDEMEWSYKLSSKPQLVPSSVVSAPRLRRQWGVSLPFSSLHCSEYPKLGNAGLPAPPSLLPSHLSLGGLSVKEICPRQLDPGYVGGREPTDLRKTCKDSFKYIILLIYRAIEKVSKYPFLKSIFC